jgi:drug/metabolite transporter (DMT)-like permease
MNYYLLAILGAILWGLHYPLLGKALESWSPLTLAFVSSMSISIIIICIHKELFVELKSIFEADTNKKLLLFGIVATSFAATYMVNLAISIGNVSTVALIEISYPIFVIIFGYLIFGNNTMTMPMIFGAALVVIGIGIITYYDSNENPDEAVVNNEIEENIIINVKG